MSSPVRLSCVVCLSPVTFVHPTQAIEIFGNVSMRKVFRIGTVRYHWPMCACVTGFQHSELYRFGRFAFYAIWYLGHLWPSVKILRRSSQGSPSVEGLNQRGVEKCSDFGPFQGYISKQCKIEGKLLLMTNRKSHMSFRLVPNSVTLNDLERRNRPNGCVISSNSVAFYADCVKVVEDTRILYAAEM